MAPTSHSLLDRVKSNDQQAWKQLVQVYGPLLLRWCRRSGLNDDDSADVCQEVFRVVSARLNTFHPVRESGSFRSWLRTITRTKIVDHFRRVEKQPLARGGTTAHLYLSQVVDLLATENEEDAVDENAVVVSRAMELIRGEFSSQNWRAFRQVALEGQTATEVAEMLGIKPQAVRQANYRIRRRLRVVLQDLFAG